MEITGDALMTNGANGEVVFEANAIDEDGFECVAVWENPDWSKANGEDYSECCDWENPGTLRRF